MKLPQFAVYVLYSLKDHQFYIGYTANFTRRMVEHSEGRSKSTGNSSRIALENDDYVYIVRCI